MPKVNKRNNRCFDDVIFAQFSCQVFVFFLFFHGLNLILNEGKLAKRNIYQSRESIEPYDDVLPAEMYADVRDKRMAQHPPPRPGLLLLAFWYENKVCRIFIANSFNLLKSLHLEAAFEWYGCLAFLLRMNDQWAEVQVVASFYFPGKHESRVKAYDSIAANRPSLPPPPSHQFNLHLQTIHCNIN